MGKAFTERDESGYNRPQHLVPPPFNLNNWHLHAIESNNALRDEV